MMMSALPFAMAGGVSLWREVNSRARQSATPLERYASRVAPEPIGPCSMPLDDAGRKLDCTN